MGISNELRNEIYINNLRHGFWDNRRDLEQLCDNIMGEVEEVTSELDKFSDPTYVYFKPEKPEKPEGAPTELSDIIIFVLDYFGDCYIPPEAVDLERSDKLPIPIDVVPSFLDFTPMDLKAFLTDKAATFVSCDDSSPAYESEFTSARAMLTPGMVFSLYFKPEIEKAISLAKMYALFERVGIPSDITISDETQTVTYQLHRVIRAVLMFCQLYGIDIDSELRRKIDYNNSRPPRYRQIGDGDPLETNREKVIGELLKCQGAYKDVDSVIGYRDVVNANMLFRRMLSERVAQNMDIKERKYENKSRYI